MIVLFPVPGPPIMTIISLFTINKYRVNLPKVIGNQKKNLSMKLIFSKNLEPILNSKIKTVYLLLLLL